MKQIYSLYECSEMRVKPHSRFPILALPTDAQSKLLYEGCPKMIENYVQMVRQHYLLVFQVIDLQRGSLATNREFKELRKLKTTQSTTNFVKQVEWHPSEKIINKKIVKKIIVQYKLSITIDGIIIIITVFFKIEVCILDTALKCGHSFTEFFFYFFVN